MRKTLTGKILLGEFPVTIPEEYTNKNRVNKCKEFFPIMKYLPTVEPIDLKVSSAPIPQLDYFLQKTYSLHNPTIHD